ncbi:MAG: LysM peptidoglycan-binding domain-containing protein, partial [Pseudomonadota bacterium]
AAISAASSSEIAARRPERPEDPAAGGPAATGADEAQDDAVEATRIAAAEEPAGPQTETAADAETATETDPQPAADPEPATAEDGADAAEDTEIAVAPTPSDGGTADAAAEAPAEDAPDAATAAAVAPEPATTIELVRIDPAGGAVIAGRTAPDMEVTITRNGEPVMTVQSSDRGEFVAILSTDPGTEPSSLNVRLGGSEGSEEPAEEVALIVLPDPEAEPGVAAPAVVAATATGTRIVQPGHLGAPDQITLDAISYDATGAVVINGRGAPGRIARVYADGVPLGEAAISAGGTWTVSVSDIDAGRYTLRIDEVGTDGTVESRVQSPFERVFPDLAERPAAIVVQPGNNLWTIARTYYGSGVRYTQIYAANASQITDPDLIFPGQIFDLPEDGG